MRKEFAGIVSTVLLLGAFPAEAAKLIPLNQQPPLAPPPEIVSKIRANPQDPAPRRELGFWYISRYDEACKFELQRLKGTQNRYAGGLSILAIWLTTIAGQTTPVRSANLLSAAASGAQSTSRAVTDVVWDGNEYSVISNAIRAGRQERRRQLYKDINDGIFDTWEPITIQAFLTDYRTDCSVSYGFERLSAASAKLGASDDEYGDISPRPGDDKPAPQKDLEVNPPVPPPAANGGARPGPAPETPPPAATVAPNTNPLPRVSAPNS